jgi:hypothetical protein
MRQVEEGGERLSTDAAEKLFQQRFSVHSGRRRLTCKSSLKVPEDMASSARREEWQGVTFGGHPHGCHAVVACRTSKVHARNLSVPLCYT